MLANLDIFKQKNPPYHTGTHHLLTGEQMAWCMAEGIEKKPWSGAGEATSLFLGLKLQIFAFFCKIASWLANHCY